MGDFLKLEWKKFILPIILIVLFFVAINSLHVYGHINDKYDCQISSLIQEDLSNMQSNNTIAANEVGNRVSVLSQDKQSEMRNVKTPGIILGVVKTIDPITPLPCENLEKSTVCRFYVTEDTYNCYKDLDFTGNIFSNPKMSEYKPVSLIIILLNVLLLFIEGYLVSSIILFFYRKITNRYETPSMG